MNNSKSNDNFYCLAKNCLETTPPDSYSISMPASLKTLVTLTLVNGRVSHDSSQELS